MSTSNMHVTGSSTAPRKEALNPEDKPIHAKNRCLLCLYNIPSGSVMVTMPGAVIFITGLTILIWQSLDESFQNVEIGSASVVLTILGGVLTAGGLTYWVVQFCKYKPKVTKVHKQTVAPRDRSVELVGVRNEAFEGSQLEISTIS